MKPNLKLLLATALAVGAALAVAQDKPPAPPPATPPPAPDSTPAPPSTDQRPLGDRHWRHRFDLDGPAGQNNGQRPPDGQNPGDGQRPPNPESSGEHREHFRHPDGAEGPGHFQHPPVPPPKPVPFIGVITAPVPPILAAQLGLPESFGLVVEGVLPNSPAAAAGLQRFDVLKLYNDQQIVDPRQLQILVHATGKDGSATLTIIRKAQEQKITVKIGEHVMAVSMHGSHHPDGAEQGPGHQRYAERGAEHHGEHHPAEQPGDNQQGPGHQEFDHHRFAGHDGEHHDGEEQRLSRNGFDHHHSFDREESRHHGFDHHGFGREGFDRQSSEHHGFGHHGFGHEGFDREGSEHHGFGHHRCGHGGFDREESEHHGFGHHGFGGEGFDRQDSEHHSFHHHGFGREGFAHHGERQNYGERQHSDRDPAHQGPGQFGGDHRQAPFDRAGRPPSPNRGPGSENRSRDLQSRPEGWHHRSSDVEQSPDAPPVEPANLLREIRPGGAAQIRVEQPDGSVVYDTANAKVSFTDAAGKIEIAVKDGHRMLLATDTQGETIFEGPIETPEQLSSVPEDIRKKIDWIESRTQTELVDAPTPAAPPKGELVQPELADALVQ